MDRWAFFFANHAGVPLIIFAIIAVAATVLKGLSEKTCPDCLNKKVRNRQKYAKNVGIGSAIKPICRISKIDVLQE